MKVFGLWHGGASYVTGDPSKYVELFESIDHARQALRDRREEGHWRHCLFQYADGRVERNLCPSVDQTSEIRIYMRDPRLEDTYSEPDRIIRFGPRGGVILNRL
jgi:hypothetical protein